MNKKDKNVVSPNFHRKSKIHDLQIIENDEFKDLIEYERSRSDRIESIFSVAAFDIENLNPKDILKIYTVISKGIRTIDRMGFLANNNIAVLLPETTKKGAETFVVKIMKGFDASSAKDIKYNIYTYPNDWFSVSEEKPHTSKKDDFNITFKQTIENLFTISTPLWKRTFDIVGAIFGIVISAPIFFLTALYIKLVSPGPIFFKQKRIGHYGKEFDFWKLRTMKLNNDYSSHKNYYKTLVNTNTPMKKLDNTTDKRIFFGGKLIRYCCIDELPQLWNILKGEMSLVGPRPCIPYEAEVYLRWHTHRFDITPGLTGLWQVSGKNNLTFREMICLDIFYSKNYSILLDLKIIFMTIPAILSILTDYSTKK